MFHKRKYACLNNSEMIESKINNNKYYLTRKYIYVMSFEGVLLKKIELPKDYDPTINEEMMGFWNMYYSSGKLIVVIRCKPGFYDRKAIMDEELLQLGALSLYK